MRSRFFLAAVLTLTWQAQSAAGQTNGAEGRTNGAAGRTNGAARPASDAAGATKPAEVASADDNARVLAGLPVPANSPLAPLEATAGWKYHARYFDAAFGRVDRAQISKAKRWSQANIDVRRPTLFYFFSGPDYLYADAFFPNAKTYVLAGLEPPGTVPDLTKLPRGALPRALRALEGSLHAILGYSFFRTIDMKSDFRENPVPGTIPVLYVFMVRSGKAIHDARLVQLDESGNIQTDIKSATPGARGVRITFAAPGGPEQTLYYFGTDISGSSFAKSGLAAFCDRLGEGDALVKSASYLLHRGGFAPVREFLLKHSAAILQDDTGIPVSFFDAGWALRPFGHYIGPISLFAGDDQPRLTQLFRKQKPGPLDFGIGYRYAGNSSNLMLAVKKSPAAVVAPPTKAAPAMLAPAKPAATTPAPKPTSDLVPTK